MHVPSRAASRYASSATAAATCLSGTSVGWNTVPMRSPAMILGMLRGSSAVQITMRQPAAVAMRAAVSLVAMPPVPHCVPRVVVSTCGGAGRGGTVRLGLAASRGSLPRLAAAKHAAARSRQAAQQQGGSQQGPRHRGRRGNNRHHSPAPAHVQLGQVWHLVDGLRLGVGAGVGCEEVGHVGQQEEPLGLHQGGHLRRQRVVVPDAQLLHRHRVVLIHDGHHAQPAGQAGQERVMRRRSAPWGQHLAGLEAGGACHSPRRLPCPSSACPSRTVPILVSTTHTHAVSPHTQPAHTCALPLTAAAPQTCSWR